MRLLHPHRPAAPALPQCPLSEAALQADDVPHARADRAAKPPEQVIDAASVLAITKTAPPAPCSNLQKAQVARETVLSGITPASLVF